MAQLTISELASQVGLRPSAIRYYERLGILPAPPRQSGQRRYDTAALNRLAVVQRARQIGFSLDEIRVLFYGFHRDDPPGKRWHELSQRKLAELNALVEQINVMRRLLENSHRCQCEALDECGRRLLERQRADGQAEVVTLNQRRRKAR